MERLEPGPELDALIAEKVMGWRLARWKNEIGEVGISWFDKDIEPTLDNEQAGYCPSRLYDQVKWGWRPSFYLVDAMRALDTTRYNWSLSRDVGLCGDTETKRDKTFRFILASPGMPMYGVASDRPAHAICLALLDAQEQDEDPTG